MARRMWIPTAITALLLLGLGAALPVPGQQRPQPSNVDPNLDHVSRASLAAKTEETYQIGAGDVLQISVWREDTLSQRAVVRPDGKITLPLIAEVTVAGKTPMEVQQILQQSFAKFVAHPAVTVTVAEVNSRVVYILGEVQRPGAYPMVHSMDVLQLIASAGGLTPFAKKKSIYLLHEQKGERTSLNYAKLLKGTDPQTPQPLANGDLVVVP